MCFPSLFPLRRGAFGWCVGASLVGALFLTAPLAAQDTPPPGYTASPSPAPTWEMSAPAAHAWLQQVFRNAQRERYGEAVDVYLSILGHWGAATDPEDAEIVQAHVDRALLAVPSAEQAGLVAAAAPGEALVAWWARQNPLPGSPWNERVAEHLTRVAYAERHFARARSPLGFDDRGVVYVRLGEPSRRQALDYVRPELLERIHALRTARGNNLLVTPASLAASEVWLYQQEGQPFHYLFVADGRGGYQVGEVHDIIPIHLRSSMDGGTGRGGAKADIVLAVLRTVYRQLAPFDMNYAERLQEVETYLGQLEELALGDPASYAESRVAGTSNRVDYSAAARRQSAAFGTRTPPDLVARGMVEASRREDHLLRRQREERGPEVRTSLLDGLEALRMAARVARFLDPDGSTRAEVYWALEPGGLPLSRALTSAVRRSGHFDSFPDHIVRATLVRNASRAERSVERVEMYAVPRSRVRAIDPLGVHVFAVDRVGEGDDLAMQWDQFLAAAAPDGIALGPRARVAVLRTQPIAPLEGDGRLEMSDLKPVLAPTEEPYPFDEVEAALPLALYFEAYGLVFGPNDEIDFAVEYEVTLQRGGGPFRRARQETTSGNLISAVQGTHTEQYLILDTASWAGAREATVNVIVTDRTTGGSVERSVTFAVTDGS
jgi:GWxTD domain-containing protein